MPHKTKLMGLIMQELQTDLIIWLRNHGKTPSTGSEYLMGCTVQFLPVQDNCSVLHSCITHMNPHLDSAASSQPTWSTAVLYWGSPNKALSAPQGLWEAKWAALGTDGTMPCKMASCTETWKADNPLTGITQALLISCLRLKNVKSDAGCQRGKK